LSGLEWASGIPGTVGGAIVGNAGTPKGEIKNSVKKVEFFDIEKFNGFSLMGDKCNFSYRSSVFKEKLKDKYIITSVSFKLSLLPRPVLDYGSLKEEINKSLVKLTAEDVRLVVERIRKEKLPDPDKLGNAGSFFKNPEVNKKKYMDLKDKFPDLKYYEISSDIFKIPAAWLIDKAGWKGKSLGLAGIWHKQALIMINNGGASFNDIKFLSKTIVCEVKNKFDIELIPEVNIID
jgi:UDP-N-acetylmuramate dehydrogenase